MLGLKVLNLTGPITWGINCHFLFKSGPAHLGELGAKESDLASKTQHFGF